MADNTTPVNSNADNQAELRIALAMSGAIALVLYESGVANEVCNFVNRVGAYRDAIADSNLNPIVDILTGASAGGINSVFLGNCFSNGASFDLFANIWIEQASIDQLRYGPTDTAASVLNTTTLKTSMGQILLGNIKPKPEYAPQYLESDDLRVRLCRTDMRGYCVNTIDALGHSIDVMSRSDVVAYDRDAFTDKNNLEDVVEAACATSAFPMAFPPVFNNGRWYVDGGLWDNQPIDLAVEAIRDKPAFNRTHRCVFFIDPDPSVIASEDDASLPIAQRKQIIDLAAKQEAKNVPSTLETLLFLPGIGIKGDVLPALESILDYNRRSDLYKQAISIPTFAKPDTRKTIAQEFEAANSNGVDAYDKLSLLTKVRIETVIFDSDPKLIQSWNAIRERKPELADLATPFITVALASLSEADIYRRAIRRVIAALNKRLLDKSNIGELDANANAHRSSKRALYKALSGLNDVLESAPNPVDDLNSETVTYREHLRARVSRFRFASETVIARLTKALQSGTLPTVQMFADWDACKPTAESVKTAEDAAKQALADINGLDRDQDVLRYVLAGISDLDEKGRIDLIRMSPNDTNNTNLIGGSPAADETAASFKLAGKGLGHMQGFFEERWRRNDYIWGRLDAAEILLRTLRTYAEREAIANGSNCVFTELKFNEALANIQNEILKAEAARYNPRAGQGTNTAAPVNADVCGTVLQKQDPKQVQLVQAENRKLIGYGSETLANAGEPLFSQNVEYIAGILPRILRGSASKPPAALDQVARISRILSYLITCVSWVFPFKPNTARAVAIRVASVVGVLLAAWIWGFGFGRGAKIGQDLVNGGLILLSACALVSLGAGLGYRFKFALYSMLTIGITAGILINANDSKITYMRYPQDLVIAAAFGAISIVLIPFAFATNDQVPQKGRLQTKIQRSLPPAGSATANPPLTEEGNR